MCDGGYTELLCRECGERMGRDVEVHQRRHDNQRTVEPVALKDVSEDGWLGTLLAHVLDEVGPTGEVTTTVFDEGAPGSRTDTGLS